MARGKKEKKERKKGVSPALTMPAKHVTAGIKVGEGKVRKISCSRVRSIFFLFCFGGGGGGFDCEGGMAKENPHSLPWGRFGGWGLRRGRGL